MKQTGRSPANILDEMHVIEYCNMVAYCEYQLEQLVLRTADDQESKLSVLRHNDIELTRLQSSKAWIKDASSEQHVPAGETVTTELSVSEPRSDLRISSVASVSPTDKAEQTSVDHFSFRSLDVADEPATAPRKRPPSVKNWIECASCGLHVQATDAVGTASCSTEPVRICLDSEARPELSIPCSTCISFAAQVGQRLAQSCPSRGSDVVTEPLSTPTHRLVGCYQLDHFVPNSMCFCLPGVSIWFIVMMLTFRTVLLIVAWTVMRSSVPVGQHGILSALMILIILNVCTIRDR
ncbi:hypothetical protein P879_10446 [Paragonimus westermani]|uniref:Uncharacterized protein n=1 Tax=Paragonimus westermani TaxID=34504 RepID=A0A8T0DH69_9TREM|nr:hypothetical protein P879_10446 [Paragonimus westermani]